ncbi:MAG TPA: TonB-dependent receptor, partial [Rhodothermales bacterium]
MAALFGLASIVATSHALAQDAALRGVVTDQSSGEPLPAVNVVIRDGDGGLNGSTTDANGYYFISRIKPGSYRLSVSFVGYATLVDSLVVHGAEVRTLNFALAPTTITGSEIVVEADEPRTAAVSAGLQVIRPQQLEMVPVPDVSGDLMAYLQVLPGMFTTGDRGGQLFIRGGTPAQNLTMIDGMPVHQPFHIIGFFSAFPAEIVRQSDVYAGGFGAGYGGRVSSVIDVTTRNGNKQDLEGSASMAPFLTALHLEGPLVKGKASVLVSVRESLVERLVPEVWSGSEPFRFGDQFVKVH